MAPTNENILNIHLHVFQRNLRRGIIPGIQQNRKRREARDEQGYCGEEAEDGLEAVEGGVHGEGSPVDSRRKYSVRQENSCEEQLEVMLGNDDKQRMKPDGPLA